MAFPGTLIDAGNFNDVDQYGSGSKIVRDQYGIAYAAMMDATTGYTSVYEGVFDWNYSTTTLYQNLTPGAEEKHGQSFTGDGSTIGSIKVYLAVSGSPTGRVYIRIYAHSGTYGTSSLPTGSPLAEASMDIADINSSEYNRFFFDTPFKTTSSTYYVFTIEPEYEFANSSNWLQTKGSNTSTHSGNHCTWFASTETWTAESGNDLYFAIYPSDGDQIIKWALLTTVTGTSGDQNPSIAISHDGIIHMSYMYAGGKASQLKYRTYNTHYSILSSATVLVEDLGEDATGFYLHCDIAVDMEGNPHIAYSEFVKKGGAPSIAYMHYNGYEWCTPIEVEGATNGDTCAGIHIEIGRENVPLIGYTNITDAEVKLAVGTALYNVSIPVTFSLYTIASSVATSNSYMIKAVVISSEPGNLGDVFINTETLTNGFNLYYHAYGAAWTSWTTISGSSMTARRQVLVYYPAEDDTRITAYYSYQVYKYAWNGSSWDSGTMVNGDYPGQTTENQAVTDGFWNRSDRNGFLLQYIADQTVFTKTAAITESFSSNTFWGQSFEGVSSYLVKATIPLSKPSSTATGFIKAIVYSCSGTFGSGSEVPGTVIGTSSNYCSVANLAISTASTDFTFYFANIQLSASTGYFIVLQMSINADVTVGTRTAESATDGHIVYSNNGSSWSHLTTNDMAFIIEVGRFSTRLPVTTIAGTEDITNDDTYSNVIHTYPGLRGSIDIESYSGRDGIITEQLTGSFTYQVYTGNIIGASQSFRATDERIAGASFLCSRVGSPTGTLYVRIYAHTGTFSASSTPTGSALAEISVDPNDIPTDSGWVRFDFSTPYQATRYAAYCIVVEYNGGDINNRLMFYYTTTDSHTGNSATYTSSWSASASSDMRFKLHYSEDNPDLDVVYLKSISGSIDAVSSTNYLADQNQTTSTTAILYSGLKIALSQSITGQGQEITGAYFLLYKSGTPSTVYFKIYAHTGTYGFNSTPTGSALASGSISGTTLETSAHWTYIPLSASYTLEDGTYYCIVVEHSGGDASNWVRVSKNSTSVVNGNYAEYSSFWSSVSSHDLGFIAIGEVYADLTVEEGGVSLSGTIAVTSSTADADITVTKPITGTVAATSTTADIDSLFIVKDISGTITVVSSVPDVHFDYLYYLTGTIAVQSSTADIELGITKKLSGTVAVTSYTADAVLVVGESLTGTVAVTSSTADVDLFKTVPIAGSITLTSSTDDARFVTGESLTGIVSLVSSTADADLFKYVPLTDTIAMTTTTSEVDVIVEIAVSGSINLTTSTQDGDLFRVINISGSVNLTSFTADADLATGDIKAISGTIAVVSSTADAGIIAVVTLSGTIAVSASTTDVSITVVKPLSGTIAVTSSTADGQLIVEVPVSGTISITSSIGDVDLFSEVSVSGSVVLASSTQDADLFTTKPLAGTINVVSSIPNAQLQSGNDFSGTIAVTSSTQDSSLARTIKNKSSLDISCVTPDADLFKLIPVSGSISLTTSTQDADLQAVKVLAGSINIVSNTSDIDLFSICSVAGSIDMASSTTDVDLFSTASISGTIAVVSNTADAKLQTGETFSGSIGVISSTTDSDLVIVKPISGTVSVSSNTADATLPTSASIAGTIAPTSVTQNADLHLLKPVSGTVAVTSSTTDVDLQTGNIFSGTIAVTSQTGDVTMVKGQAITGSISASSHTGDASLWLDLFISGTITVISNTSDALLQSGNLFTGTIAVISSSTDADLNRVIEETGTINIISQTGDANTSVSSQLSGAVDSISVTLAADLTRILPYSGTIDVTSVIPNPTLVTGLAISGLIEGISLTQDGSLELSQGLVGTIGVTSLTGEAVILLGKVLSGQIDILSLIGDSDLGLDAYVAGDINVDSDTSDPILARDILYTGTIPIVSTTGDAVLSIPVPENIKINPKGSIEVYVGPDGKARVIDLRGVIKIINKLTGKI